ncbi:acyltransferase family protein [Pseudonocardia acaciae]|uniref:acyltransferase family protein n=1 Tax=Pseudonocardia acaciae TaxID=551276 RepID=UPI00068465C5|nr:acyltransferase family protein [Pseudonocardia acaciae]
MARAYRPELQGLRALAALLVVVYHVWLGRVSGGVDVFFVISGFLLTGQLVRAGERGAVALRAVYARMVGRLLPASVTVLLAIIAVGVVLLPENRWFGTIREVIASVLFVENWQLAADSADYFAQHGAASVVQHFWSLSVQGQFFLLWPLVGVAVVWLGRRLRVSPRAGFGAVSAVVLVGSLAYSVWLTSVNQPLAYFDTLARAWEFALGGLLALVIDAVPLPRAVRIGLGWAGVAGLVSCGLVLTVGTQFPGYVALWPTLSAVAVLAAGASDSRIGVDRILASRPLRRLGDLSFGLYLWHWPILVLFLVSQEREEPGPLGGAAVIALSLLLAAGTHHLVERPVVAVAGAARTSGGAERRTPRLAVAALLPVLMACGVWQGVSARKAQSYALTFDDPDHPGALAMRADFEYWGAQDPPLAPPFVSLPDDWASVEGLRCEDSPRGGDLEICRLASPGPPTRKVVLVGDSHPTQFLAALRPIAQRRHWEIIMMSRPGCPYSADSEILPDDRQCLDWNAAATEEILADPPDFVFTMATRDVRAGLTEHTPAGFVAQWQKLETESIPVLAVRDNPRYARSPAGCVEAGRVDVAECGTPRADLLAPTAPYRELSDVPPNVLFLDFSDYYCDPEMCPAVIGNILVYKDDNHLSATYLTSMAGIVENAIDSALDRYAARNSPS